MNIPRIPPPPPPNERGQRLMLIIDAAIARRVGLGVAKPAAVRVSLDAWDAITEQMWHRFHDTYLVIARKDPDACDCILVECHGVPLVACHRPDARSYEFLDTLPACKPPQ